MARRYLVKTDHGDVLVEVNERLDNALDKDFLHLSVPSPEALEGIEMEVPLRAFGAKMLELVEMVGTGDFEASPSLKQMMMQEKATASLKDIERFARKQVARQAD